MENIILNPDYAQMAQYIGGAAAALIMLAFVIQKFISLWKVDSTEMSVLTLMHTELERMSSHNTALSVALGEFQKEVLTLNKQIHKLTVENTSLGTALVDLQKEVLILNKQIHRLTVENQQLHTEVALLNKEIGRLQTTLNKDSQEQIVKQIKSTVAKTVSPIKSNKVE